MRLVLNGKRPDRLENPKMEDNTWNIIQSCWESIPSTRPTMEQIAMRLTSLAKLTEWPNDLRAHSMTIPGLDAVGDLLSAIITLCDSLPQNKHVLFFTPQLFLTR